MAITNAQQFKQLVNPPMEGKKRPGYRGEAAAASDRAGDRDAGRDTSAAGTSDRGDGPASRDFGGPGRDEQMGMKGKTRPGRNPMAQFTGDVDTKNLTFMDEMRRKVNPLGVLTQIPGGIGIAARFLTPNPFGFGPKPFDAQGFGSGQGDGPQTMEFIPAYIRAGFKTQEEYDEFLASQDEDAKEEKPFQLARRFRAEGGIMDSDVVGGEFDFESARQMYGLGKLVKKVTRTVKKIAKSPIGKAALLYAGGTYLGGSTALGGSGGSFMSRLSNPSNLMNLKNIFSMSKIPAGPFEGGVANFAGDRLAFNAARTAAGSGASGGLLDLIGGKAGAAIIGSSLLAGLTTEQQQEVQDLVDNSGFSIEEARNAVLARARDDYKMDVRARGFRAEGGPAEGKEPVAKKTMPLLDMGGQEMDLRAEGGFVPIGRMEKADDVPARLSKNEFVFTADAVRNAGEGDVDKGAEVMYNMMKNLEAGGEVSEESQGLEGARKMFQTSQRLEEVL